ncbi:CGP-CTERM sorting domain-containing protein [Thermococcus sp.]|uniref:CGP-CTERM sorting domain-containing protein n=1 Tax=Thermococcus sp. TaxID=35749 RepID=UPI002608EF01|nr:CGP-CTERM sorting domain-containing protein [Thermococcus sp.]
MKLEVDWMKKFAFVLMLIFALSVLPGSVLAQSGGYSEKLQQTYIVSWDGSANVTFITTFYGPPELLNQTKGSIAQMGIENATRLFVQQQVQALAKQGITLVNATGEIKGYNTTGPLVSIVRGKALNVAKYYSYDGVWEIDLDLLRTADLAGIDPTKFNQSFDFDNYYIVQLPQGAKIKEVPPSYRKESNGSYVFIQTNVTGETVEIHSHVHFARNVTMSDIQAIYGQPKAFVIQYTGRKGSEGNYTTWVLSVINNITVGKDVTIMNTTQEYLRPESYINYLKMQIMYQGEERIIQSIYQSYAKSFQEEGVGVKSWDIKLLNVNSTGPLVVKLNWELTNYTKYSNGSYVYTYDPTLGLNKIPSLNRLEAEINQTVVTHITLPDGAKFTQIPKDINIDANGSRVIMRVKKVSDRELVITSQVFLRYGMKTHDYSAMMAKVPTQVEFKYTMSEKSGGICGPAAILGLAVIPLVLRRRRR